MTHDGCAVDGVGEGQRQRVEGLPAEIARSGGLGSGHGAVSSIEPISHDGSAVVRAVDSDLMGAPRLEAAT